MILPKKDQVIIKFDSKIPDVLQGYKVAKIVISNAEDYYEDDIIYFLDGFGSKIVYNGRDYYVLDSRHIDFVED